MDIYSVFSRNLKFYRCEKGLSQNELSKLSGVSEYTIGGMERKSVPVKLSDIETIAKVLEIPAYFLFMTETIID